MNARQKVKKLKKEIEFYKKKVITPKIIGRNDMCRCRAVTYIYPDQVRFINEPRFLDNVATALAAEFKVVTMANMRLEDHKFFDGTGKIAIFDIFYIKKGGDT